MKNETWAEIGISQGGRIKYSVSNMGRCKRENLITGEVKIDHGYQNKNTGYFCFCDQYVHRLVAMLFVPNDRPDVWVECDHIDSNRKNNRASNLRWVDMRYNRGRIHANRLRRTNARATDHAGQIIQGVNHRTGETRTWKNGIACAHDLGCSHVLVYNALGHKGSARSAKGFVLQWIPEGA